MFADGRLEEAKSAYRRALQQQPTHLVANHRLGVIADQQQDFGNAEKHYLTALKVDSSDPNLLSDLGYSYLLQQRFREAEEYFQRALKVQPTHSKALNNLGLLYSKQNEYDKALAVFRRAGSEAEAQRKLATLFPSGRSGAGVTGSNSFVAAHPTAPAASSFGADSFGTMSAPPVQNQAPATQPPESTWPSQQLPSSNPVAANTQQSFEPSPAASFGAPAVPPQTPAVPNVTANDWPAGAPGGQAAIGAAIASNQIPPSQQFSQPPQQPNLAAAPTQQSWPQNTAPRAATPPTTEALPLWPNRSQANAGAQSVQTAAFDGANAPQTFPSQPPAGIASGMTANSVPATGMPQTPNGGFGTVQAGGFGNTPNMNANQQPMDRARQQATAIGMQAGAGQMFPVASQTPWPNTGNQPAMQQGQALPNSTAWGGDPVRQYESQIRSTQDLYPGTTQPMPPSGQPYAPNPNVNASQFVGSPQGGMPQGYNPQQSNPW